MNFEIGCVVQAGDECARCGKPWLHPDWRFWQSYPVALIKPHDDDPREVWCDSCVRQTSPRTWELLKAEREHFYRDAPPDAIRPPDS